MAKHYVIVDDDMHIIRGWSSKYDPDQSTDNAICITEDGGDNFELLGDTNPVMTSTEGAHLYKYDKKSKSVVATTTKEQSAELDSLLVSPKIEELINLSKLMLQQFLEDNPMKSSCHAKEERYYSVTLEKQSMFTSKYTAHVTLLQAGIANDMTWNSTGDPCESWTDEECIQFINEMNSYVTPIVSYQQKLELDIKACKTLTELSKISINYDQFKQ